MRASSFQRLLPSQCPDNLRGTMGRAVAITLASHGPRAGSRYWPAAATRTRLDTARPFIPQRVVSRAIVTHRGWHVKRVHGQCCATTGCARVCVRACNCSARTNATANS